VPLHVAVTTGGSRTATGTTLVSLLVGVFTSSDVGTPIPAGRIEYATIGGISRVIYRGIDASGQGRLAEPAGAGLARTEH